MESQENSEAGMESQENSEANGNNNPYFFRFAVGFAVIAIVLLIFGMSNPFGASAGSVSAQTSVVAGDAQVVKMKVVGGRYILEPSSFKKGIPVRIEADMSQMPGCSKSVVISAFGIRKNLNSGNSVIEFTPDKAGTFNIACSMNMYRGTFNVLDSDGTKTNYVEPAPSGGGTCGGGGGGCGCGS